MEQALSKPLNFFPDPFLFPNFTQPIFDKGLVAANAGDFATALCEWTPLANQGNANEQFYLGCMYENGQGVAFNSILAYALYSVSKFNDSSELNKSNENRKNLSVNMSTNSIESARNLFHKLINSKNFLDEFDKFAVDVGAKKLSSVPNHTAFNESLWNW